MARMTAAKRNINRTPKSEGVLAVLFALSMTPFAVIYRDVTADKRIHNGSESAANYMDSAWINACFEWFFARLNTFSCMVCIVLFENMVHSMLFHEADRKRQMAFLSVHRFSAGSYAAFPQRLKPLVTGGVLRPGLKPCPDDSYLMDLLENHSIRIGEGVRRVFAGVGGLR